MLTGRMTLAVAALVAVSLALTACGRKGPLERPPAAKAGSETPRTADGKPDRPFILDKLLR
ncbi:MAG: lipoprotein [Hyphomicrobiales bacterium]